MSATFGYTARTRDGQFVSGSLSAENRDQALAHLRTRSLFVTSLAEPDGATGLLSRFLWLLPISNAARLTFMRSLATLMRAGVPLRRSMEIVTESCRDGRLREALAAVSSDIESGVPLSGALERRPNEFPVSFVAMIRASEVSGNVDRVLERAASLAERDHAARKRLLSALSYPAIVAAFAVALVLFLVSNTVPAFAQLFAQMHVPLPLTTRWLLAIGRALGSGWTYAGVALCATALFGGLSALRRTEPGRLVLESLWSALPVLGDISKKSMLGRFARTLGTLLSAGVALLDAIDHAAGVIGNASYRRRAAGVCQALGQGSSITQALERASLFESLTIALVRVGEETGSLDEMLIRIAEHYELDVETSIASLAAVVEPLVIVLLGSIIGTIVGSILIPLYSMIGSIK